MNKLIFGIVIVAMLIAFSVPASAKEGAVPIDQLNRYEEIVPNGSYWVDWNDAGATSSFNVPDVDLYKVRIYNSAWMPGVTTATYPNVTTPLPDRYPMTCDYTLLTGLGTCGIWYPNDTVKNVTIPGETNTYRRNGDGYHGTALTILYQDTNNPNSIDSWFYQGYDDSINYEQGPSPYTYNMTYTFHNVTESNHTHWTLMVAVTCGNDDGDIDFNNNALPNGYGPTNGYYHVATNNVTGMVQNGTNVVKVNTTDMYFHPYWMWLVGYDPLPKPDLTIEDDIIVIDPVTPRPDNNFMVNATILNQGEADAGSFSVSLYANGVLNGTKPVSGLGIGNSETVSFTGVNLPEGCYEFKVVADVYDEVDESNEINNESDLKKCQVGYVIVVESDSDFAALASDTGMPLGSVTYYSGNDTYYIQDLTITNCAGDGISIEGTTKNFVIKDCTIENCAPDASGVFLNDVTKGTITGCTLQNNEAYGIELGLVPLDSEDPKNINITCNTIYQNGISGNKNGIDLIGFDCIVAYNHVISNGEYGIYVFGNDSTIHNNTIANNVDYGIKLYNSSGNYIYRNDFSNNNGTGEQGWDNRATNTWNTPTPVAYCYNTETKTNYSGNYWTGYTGDDPDADGIGNTAHALDSYPAYVPWWRCGDVNRDGRVNAIDGLAIMDSKICSSRWAANANGCVDCSVNSIDALRIFAGTQDCCPTCCWYCGCSYCDR